jgi:hypothetical protein
MDEEFHSLASLPPLSPSSSSPHHTTPTSQQARLTFRSQPTYSSSRGRRGNRAVRTELGWRRIEAGRASICLLPTTEAADRGGRVPFFPTCCECSLSLSLRGMLARFRIVSPLLCLIRRSRWGDMRKSLSRRSLYLSLFRT